ncbi:MAG: HAMP domain-containing protein [Nitrospirae bacterium]|nr:HAMP domain-containing protein [Nitrospirota bacterium]
MKMNLRNKSILVMTLILISVLGVNTAVLIKGVTDRYKTALLNKTTVIGEEIKRDVSRPVEVGVPIEILTGLNEKLKRLSDENKDIGYSMIVDSKGKVLFHNNADMVGKILTPAEIAEIESIKTDETINSVRGNYYETTLPVFYEKKPVGVVKVALKQEEVSAQISSMLLGSITVASIGLIIVITLVAFFITRFIAKPITTVASTALEMSSGDFTKTIEISSKDEVGELGRAINRMIKNLSEIISRFKSTTINVSMASEQIAMNSKKMTEGAKTQVDAVEKTASSIQELNSSIREIADSTGTLSNSAVETSSSILEVSASIEGVAQSADSLSNAISEVTASVEEMVASADEGAKSMEVLEEAIGETSTTIVEFDAAIGTVADNAKEATRLADKVVTDASEHGMISVVNAIDGMDKIRDSVKKAGDSVNHLRERAHSISKIITFIDEVTDQTTLLALNAAIIAAQAGEHGKGFAVVADEIKALAEKTSTSTKEIDTLIQTIQKETQDAVNITKEGLVSVEEGGKLVHSAGDVLRGIINSSQQSQNAIKGIEGAAIEQAKGVRQVAEAVDRIKDMIVQVARASQELRNGTNHIEKVMGGVSDIAKQLKKSTEEQSKGSKQIGVIADNTAEKTQLIAKATNDQRFGSETILKSIDDVRAVAMKGMDIASEIDLAMEALRREAEDLKKEIERFKIK